MVEQFVDTPPTFKHPFCDEQAQSRRICANVQYTAKIRAGVIPVQQHSQNLVDLKSVKYLVLDVKPAPDRPEWYFGAGYRRQKSDDPILLCEWYLKFMEIIVYNSFIVWEINFSKAIRQTMATFSPSAQKLARSTKLKLYLQNLLIDSQLLLWYENFIQKIKIICFQ